MFESSAGRADFPDGVQCRNLVVTAGRNGTVDCHCIRGAELSGFKTRC
jgi:hypothetical protein